MSSPVHDVDALTTWRCRHPICGATQRPSEYGYMQAGRSSLAPRLAYLKLAGRVRYRRSDIDAYEQAGFVSREPARTTSFGDPSEVRETVERLIRSLGS
jgi:hypothetical protein